MIIAIDAESSVPPYEQLVGQIERLITTGQLPAGHRLPPIRQLSHDLGLAPGTVARAYRDLETAGQIETRGRHGTFVRAEAPRAVTSRRLLERAARAFAQESRQLGFERSAALKLVDEAFRHAAR